MKTQENLMPLEDIIVQAQFLNNRLSKYLEIKRLKVDRAELDKIIEIRNQFQNGDKLAFEIFSNMAIDGIYLE